MLMVTIILCMLSVLCYVLYYQYYSYFSLWIGVVISFLAVFSAVLKGKKETGKLLSIVVFLISLQTIALWRTKPWGFIETDSSHCLQLTDLINEQGRWYIGQGFLQGERSYSYFPLLHVWTVALSEITGLTPVFLARFVFPILSGSLTIVFYYLALRLLLTKKVATWASLVLCFNPVFVFFDAGYIHESFALTFYAMYLMVIFRAYRSRERKFMIVGILAALATVLSHHWSAYNLLIISGIFLVLPDVYAGLFPHARFGRRHPISSGFVVLTWAIVLLWISFVALSIFIQHMGLASDILVSVLSPFESPYEHAMEPYTLYEVIFIFAGLLVLATLGVMELAVGLSRRDKRPGEYFFESWFIFSSIYIFSFTYLVPMSFLRLAINKRSWPFAFFGLSPLIAKSVAKEHNPRRGLASRIGRKKSFTFLKPLILIFPLISCVLLAPIYYRRPSFFLPGDSYYSGALWIRQYLPGETITVDLISEPVLRIYGRVDINPASDLDQVVPILYQSEDIDSIPEDWRILVFNKYVSARYSDVSANPSILNKYCNRLYDSEPLTIFARLIS